MQRPLFLHHRATATTILAVVVALPFSAFTYAVDEDMWRMCIPQELVPSPSTGKLATDSTRVSAARASRNKDKVLVLQGDVQIERGSQSLQAERAEYTEQNEYLQAEGNVLYRSEQLQLRGERAEVQMDKQSGRFEQIDYLYPELHVSGTAKRLIQHDENHSNMEQVSFSTCDPDDRIWQIKAKDIELNQETHQGIARDLSLYINDVPILPMPYLRFPIGSERMSGLLFPEIAYDGGVGNLDLAVPYYWNIAPNYDATITPHMLSARGVMLQNEWRYLTPHSGGILEFEYLPDDRLTGTDRGLLAYKHKTQYTSGWSHNAELNYVSEQTYYNDLGSNAELSRQPYLKNQLSSLYSRHQWNFTGTVQAFQTLSGVEQYQRMPQLSIIRKPDGNNRLNTLFNSEYNYFYAESKQNVGSRLTTQIGISYPYTTTAGFVTPRLSLHSSQYQLEDTLANTTSQSTRELPIFSLDSGLFFERNLANNSLIQTLEPRLYYLYVPYVDQSPLPVFDSADYTFDFNQLFRENRFTGADRIADANQLSMALSSRFLAANSGEELFSASLGQVLYFEDRQVQLLNATATQTDSNSDYVAELKARIGPHWNWKSDLLWQPDTTLAKKFNSRLQYKSDKAHIANLNYTTQSNGT
ncbi:MAG: LPS assembly protein LptD, partial [Gammaproteobacteria bacterium]|nr:LPS assembly protein LptD [Gammaproteobacteria bacterium]